MVPALARVFVSVGLGETSETKRVKSTGMEMQTFLVLIRLLRLDMIAMSVKKSLPVSIRGLESKIGTLESCGHSFPKDLR